jgi:hypothetical protein
VKTTPAENIEKAFWVGFSVEQLCTLASEDWHPLDFSTVVLRKRLSFNEQIDKPILGPWNQQNDGNTVLVDVKDPVSGNKIQQLRTIVGYEPPKIEKGDSPSHGNYLTAFGCDKAEFEKLFSEYGKISHGVLSGPRDLVL